MTFLLVNILGDKGEDHDHEPVKCGWSRFFFFCNFPLAVSRNNLGFHVGRQTWLEFYYYFS